MFILDKIIVKLTNWYFSKMFKLLNYHLNDQSLIFIIIIFKEYDVVCVWHDIVCDVAITTQTKNVIKCVHDQRYINSLRNKFKTILFW